MILILKYLKWILLVFLIIFSVILTVKIIGYSNKNNVIDETEIKKRLYNSWILTKIQYYENNKLVNEVINFDEVYYMMFYSDIVRYCDKDNIECIEYSYLYNNDKITINSEDYFITEGTYNITFGDNEIILSTEDEVNKKIYYLSGAVG